jgi:drug/metabolite transporter (DMT)-like permease
VLLFFGSGERVATAPDPARGNVIAIASGLFYACLMVGLRWLAAATRGGRGARPRALWGNVLAFAAALPMALPVVASRPVDWAVIAYLGDVPDRPRLLPDDPRDAHADRARHRGAAAASSRCSIRPSSG